jgi:hypothetical protein
LPKVDPAARESAAYNRPPNDVRLYLQRRLGDSAVRNLSMKLEHLTVPVSFPAGAAVAPTFMQL